MGIAASYRLRLERKGLLLRAWRRGRELTAVRDRTASIAPGQVLLAGVFWNERKRLPYFLKYYRKLGVEHFLIIDNHSDDGSAEYLARQADVSLWQATGSYRRARYGMDWINWILRRHASGHWVVTADADEFLVFPFSDTRPLPALTEWLDENRCRTFGAMLLDLYPKGGVASATCAPAQDPVEVAPWFDGANYTVSRNPKYGNLWIQGGVRARSFFADRPQYSPSLNKIPLVKWSPGYAYVNSTHMLLPRGLNLTYDAGGGEKTTGCLLHTKLLDTFPQKVAAEAARKQHFAGGQEYKAYQSALEAEPAMWTPWSEHYINWRQLEVLGLMSKGNWA